MCCRLAWGAGYSHTATLQCEGDARIRNWANPLNSGYLGSAEEWEQLAMTRLVMCGKGVVSMSETRGPRGMQVHGFRMALWEEHTSVIHPSFYHPSSMECVQQMRNMGKTNWEVSEPKHSLHTNNVWKWHHFLPRFMDKPGSPAGAYPQGL